MFRPYFTFPINVNGMPVYYNVPYIVQDNKKKIKDEDLLNELKKYIDQVINSKDLADKDYVKRHITDELKTVFESLSTQNTKIINTGKRIDKFNREANDKIEARFILTQLVKQIFETIPSQLSIGGVNSAQDNIYIFNSNINDSANIPYFKLIPSDYIQQINNQIDMLNKQYNININKINI